MVYSIDTLNSTQNKKPLPTQSVIGFPISVLSFEEQVDAIMRWAKAGLSKIVFVSNVHMLMEGHWHPEFAQILLRKADLLTPDGMPLVWMTSLMNGYPQERVAGMELMLALSEQAQHNSLSLFLLGSTPEILAKIRQQLLADFPRLQVVGMISPPFRPLDSRENEAILDEINHSGARLVFVSLGCPKQEQWMSENRDKVQAVMVGIGGVFSIYAGIHRLAPMWMRRSSLEWCYRLVQEPRRLWKRYASTIPPFMWLAFKQFVKVKLGISPDVSLTRKFFGVTSSF